MHWIKYFKAALKACLHISHSLYWAAVIPPQLPDPPTPWLGSRGLETCYQCINRFPTMTAEGDYNSLGIARSQYYHFLFVLNQRHASVAELFCLCVCAYNESTTVTSILFLTAEIHVLRFHVFLCVYAFLCVYMQSCTYSNMVRIISICYFSTIIIKIVLISFKICPSPRCYCLPVLFAPRGCQ